MDHEIQEPSGRGHDSSTLRRLGDENQRQIDSLDDLRHNTMDEGRVAESSSQEESADLSSRVGEGDSDALSKEATAWKEKGNCLYGKKDYDGAIEAYQSGLDCYVPASRHEALSSIRLDEVEVALRLNLALALLKLDLFDRAESECSYVLRVEPDNPKGAF